MPLILWTLCSAWTLKYCRTMIYEYILITWVLYKSPHVWNHGWRTHLNVLFSAWSNGSFWTICCFIMTSQWSRWQLKSPASLIIYSTVYSGADKRKHQCSASLAFVRGIDWWPVNSPHKWPVRWKMFPFDDVIMLKRKHIAIEYKWLPIYFRIFNLII